MRWSDEDWKRFLDNMKHLSVESVSMPAELYILVFKAPHNRLFLNLYWESVRYIRFAYLMVRKDQAVLTDQELEEIRQARIYAPSAAGALSNIYRRLRIVFGDACAMRAARAGRGSTSSCAHATTTASRRTTCSAGPTSPAAPRSRSGCAASPRSCGPWRTALKA